MGVLTYNACFGLLGYVVERASGMPYHDHVHARVLGPARMTHTRWYEVIEQRAVGYWVDSGAVADPEHGTTPDFVRAT